MDKNKLAELRKAKAQGALNRHKELVSATADVKDALNSLYELINGKETYDDSKLVAQLKELQSNTVLKDQIEQLEQTIKDKTDIKVKDLDQLIKQVSEINNADVVNAINNLTVKLETQFSQQAKDYQPVRRVRKVGNRFVFDDEKVQVNVSAPGSSVQSGLTRNGNAIAVVNPDGSDVNGLIAGQDFDYIDVQQTSSTVETYVYKSGGATGSIVQTIVVTYTSSAKTDINTVEYS